MQDPTPSANAKRYTPRNSKNDSLVAIVQRKHPVWKKSKLFPMIVVVSQSEDFHPFGRTIQFQMIFTVRHLDLEEYNSVLLILYTRVFKLNQPSIRSKKVTEDCEFRKLLLFYRLKDSFQDNMRRKIGGHAENAAPVQQIMETRMWKPQPSSNYEEITKNNCILTNKNPRLMKKGPEEEYNLLRLVVILNSL